MRRICGFVAAMTFIVAGACGGDGYGGPTNPNPNPSGNRTMTATIDGSAFTAIGVGVSTTNGLLILAGADASGRAIGISANMLQGTGTQTIGGNSVASGNVIIGSNSWVAGATVTGGTGSVTLTTLTASHAVGTFSFTAPSQSATATPATRVVTNGHFDVTWP